MIRLLLVDDHAVFRQPFSFMLNRELDMEVVAQAGTVAEARSLLTVADVVLVDLMLPDGSGLEVVRELRKANPEGKALMLTSSSGRAEAAQAIEAGAVAVLQKTARMDEILDAIRKAHAGEEVIPLQETIELLRYASRQREANLQAQKAITSLTRREREVLDVLAQGLTDKDIAARLGVSLDTVRTHMVSILNKLGVDSRLQALVFAVRHGLVLIGGEEP